MTHAASGCYHFDIRGTDTDHHDQLNLSALFSYMQEAAFRHFEEYAPDRDLGERGLCWVLIRLSVRLQRWPQWKETVAVQTWQSGIRRLTFLRQYRFLDQTGGIIGEATSEWLIVDQKKHKPAKPPQEWADTVPASREVGCERLDSNYQWPEKPILVKYADYSDIDRNQHVNNTRYVAWSIDAIQAMRRHDDSSLPPPVHIRQFDIYYRRETSLGTRLDLFCLTVGESEETFEIRAVRHSDGIELFRARAVLDESNC